MALIGTLFERIQPNYRAKFDKNEIRPSIYGALQTFSDDVRNPLGILTPDDITDIMRSFGRKGGNVLPAISTDVVSIGSTRSCTVAQDENTSVEFLVTYTTYAWGFTMVRSQYIQNPIAYQQDFDRKMRKYMIQLAKDLDSQCIAQLETDKNQVYPGSVTAIFPVLADALRVPNAEQNDLYNQADVVAELQDFEADFNVIASTGHKPIIRRLNAQGGGNSTNEAFQFGGYNYEFTNRIANGSGVESTAFIIPEGNLAVVNRNDWDSQLNHRSTNGKIWEEVTLPMPIPMSGMDTMKVGSLHFSDCSNAINDLGTDFGGHSEASLLEAFSFSTDVTTISAFSSDRGTVAGPIQKYEVLS